MNQISALNNPYEMCIEKHVLVKENVYKWAKRVCHYKPESKKILPSQLGL